MSLYDQKNQKLNEIRFKVQTRNYNKVKNKWKWKFKSWLSQFSSFSEDFASK